MTEIFEDHRNQLVMPRSYAEESIVSQRQQMKANKEDSEGDGIQSVDLQTDSDQGNSVSIRKRPTDSGSSVDIREVISRFNSLNDDWEETASGRTSVRKKISRISGASGLQSSIDPAIVTVAINESKFNSTNTLNDQINGNCEEIAKYIDNSAETLGECKPTEHTIIEFQKLPNITAGSSFVHGANMEETDVIQTSITPSFWLYALGLWDLRDLYYLIEGPSYGRGRLTSFICLVLEICLSVMSVLLGDLMARTFKAPGGGKEHFMVVTIYSIVCKYILTLLTVSVFRVTRKRRTLTQQKRKYLLCRWIVGIIVLSSYLPGVAFSGLLLFYESPKYSFDLSGVREMMVDWAWFFATDIPVSLGITALRYYFWANPCYKEKNTTSIKQYKAIVMRNRRIQLRLESMEQV